MLNSVNVVRLSMRGRIVKPTSSVICEWRMSTRAEEVSKLIRADGELRPGCRALVGSRAREWLH